ncbi:MAG: hypothetical protein AOA65_2158 [Candidatus Bathyarchaeota archaeon BA1]|nr:MAG: hypothetical protein AOA65_2158 [Candidatus Bathyarchaeota archaeon BA1]
MSAGDRGCQDGARGHCQYEVVAYVESIDMDMLGNIIEKVELIKWVLRTRTAISIPTRHHPLSPPNKKWN